MAHLWQRFPPMGRMVSLAELQRAGIVFGADEAVAIVRRIIRQQDADPSSEAPLGPPFGPPSLATVFVGDDGTVECRGCEATPSAAEVALVLHAMLADTPYVAGGLRYAVARALHEVDAPPFDSARDFSTTIARFEPADPDACVRRLMLRWTTVLAAGRGSDRRRGARSPDDLRRQLRDADRRMYETRAAQTPPAIPPPTATRRGWIAGAVLAGAVTLGAAVAWTGAARASRPPAPVSASVALAPAPNDTPAAAPDTSRPGVRAAAQRVREHPKRPVRAVRAPSRRDNSALRLRWMRKRIAFRDDLP